MLFHSYTFFAFLLVVAVLHGVSPRRAQRYILLLASYVFYGSWNIRYSLLILGSTIVDYVAAGRIQRSRGPARRRWWLVASLSANLATLGFFKYFNLVSETASQLVGWTLPLHQLLLPVGISFYTFQSMSYTIDVYRGEARTARDFVDFALFVSFFPQLVAGPIVRAVEFLPQIERRQERNAARTRHGLLLFGVGLFKKLALADNLSVLVDSVHAAPEAFGPGDLWIAAYAFAFQIYLDFSGYSDMAVGTAMLFGFEFPDNFRRPYCAAGVAEFWRRWHITLSTWLRDYLFIPLGGSRNGRAATGRNLMITMLLGGLWHGAQWTFLAWGGLHGGFLAAQRLFRRLRSSLPILDWLASKAIATPFFVLLTFHAWVVSMVLFRASSFEVAGNLLGRMATGGFGGATRWGVLGLCVALYVVQVADERLDLWAIFESSPLLLRATVLVVGFWLVVLLAPTEAQPFLYFQF